jgi:hypothetical protein
MRKSFLFLLLSFFSAIAMAQPVETLPTEKDAFVKGLIKMFDDTKRTDLKDLSKNFETAVKSGKFSDELLTQMIESTNKMLVMRGKAYPQLSEMTDAYLKINDLKLNSEKLRNIHNTLLKVMDDSKKGDTKTTLSFLDFVIPLYQHNALYFSPSKSFFVTSDAFELKYEAGVGPVVIVPKADLIGATPSDTMKIFNTGGKYDYLKNIWTGKKGDVNWAKAGLPTNEVFASFGEYTIDFSKTSYTVDNVTFTYKNYFSKPITGKLEDKLLPNVTKENARYPRFVANSGSVPPQEITSNIIFYGGFSLSGSKISGAGDSDSDEIPKLVIYKPGTKEIAITAYSSELTVTKPEKVTIGHAAVSLYFGKDSIHHPSVNLVYNLQTDDIKLLRADGSLGQSKFLNSFHMMDFDADVVTWNLKGNYIDVNTISTSGEKAAYYESKEFFHPDKMREIRGNVSYDPLSLLKKHYEKTTFDEIMAADYAKLISPTMTVQQVKPLIYQLVREGFITYDEKYELIKMKPKIDHFVRSMAKHKDYDNIRIESKTKAQNGRINLTTNEIELEGVSPIPISDVSTTLFKPDQGKINILKNRDMRFDGMFFCGRLDFWGKGHNFKYDSFDMVLPQVDSLAFNIPDGDKLDVRGNPILVPVNSVIEGLVGHVNINIPINKSGRADLPQFPQFTSKEKSKVFYEMSTIRNGSYTRDRFWYEVLPFKLDSLNRLSKDNLVFQGTLFSADIFPPLNEPLRVQNDLYLGFELKTPPQGYEIYRKKGRFTSDLALNGKGLTGRGSIDFQTTNFVSREVRFYPDSLFATADDFTIKESKGKYESPSVRSSETDIRWYPYADTMFAKSKATSPFMMYNNKMKFDGQLIITSKGINAGGVGDWDDAQLISNNFLLKSEELLADTAQLQIKSIEGDKVTFNTPNVNAYVNFKNNTGFFKSNLDDNKTDFGYNQYSTSIDEFFWDIDAKKLQFSVPKGSEGATFTSLHPDQDGLNFKATSADYSLITSIIEAHNVKEILVADSRVIPKDGEVSILPEAKMQTLKDAVLEANAQTKKHIVENATLDIMGKNKMTGNGRYKYITRGQQPQYFNLSDINVVLADSSMLDKKKKQKIDFIVNGKGDIPRAQNFVLYPNVNYYGEVEFFSTLDEIKINGFTKIDFKSPYVKADFFNIKTLVNPDNLEMTLEGAKDPMDNDVRTGIFVNKMNNDPIFTKILSNEVTPLDVPMIETKGILKHKFETNEYIFGDEAKINKEEDFVKGSILKFTPDNHKVYAEGELNLSLEYGALYEKFYGSVETDLSKNLYSFHTTLTLPIEFDKTVLDKMGYYFFEDNFDAPDVKYSNPRVMQHWVEMLPEKTFKKVKQDYESKGTFAKPKEIGASIVLTDIEMVYNPEDRAYRSEGRIGVAFMGDRAVHKKLNGWVEFGHRMGADYMNIYLITHLNDWMYITYTGTNMEVISSYDDLNRTIASVDGSKRRVKVDNSFYIYTIGSELKAKGFLQRMKELKEGTEE